ncbi:MAG: DsbA family protein [Pseudomonadales bacterium]|nr:DsbA family protein [Pseudomonadales bacterium]
MKKIEMYYDFRSPFAYFASQRLALLTAEDVEIVRKPVLVDVLLNLQADREPTSEVLDPMCPAKRDHFMADIFRMIKYWNIDFAPPKPTPPACNIAMATASVMETNGVEHSAFGNAIFEAVWQKQLDVNDISILERILKDMNHDPEIIQVAKVEGMEALIQKSITAYESGVFGVPTFVWGNELFFGADRMELLAWSTRTK